MSDECVYTVESIPKDDDAYEYKVTPCGRFEGKYVTIRLPMDITKETKTEFIKRIAPPVFKNRSLPPGVYTYVLFDDDQFWCVPVENSFELSSFHHRLVYEYAQETGKKTIKIKAAGELNVQARSVLYNLQSGSYMTRLDEKCYPGIAELVHTHLTTLFPEKSIEYQNASFIKPDLMPLTLDKLNAYVRQGFEVRLYNESDKKFCNNSLLHPDYVFRTKLMDKIQAAYGEIPMDKMLAGLETFFPDDALYQQRVKEFREYSTKYTVYRPGGGRRRKTRRRQKKRITRRRG